MVSMQGPPVYRIISFDKAEKNEVIERLSGCDFQSNPYIIDLLKLETDEQSVIEILEMYFAKKFARELRLYPLYVISNIRHTTAHFYIATSIEQVGTHFKKQEKKNLSAAESAKLKLYKAGIDHFHSIPPINKKGILLNYSNRRKALYKEFEKARYYNTLWSKL